MRGRDLLRWLASIPTGERDRAIEAHLGIGDGAPAAPPGDHAVGYHASGVAPIVHALMEASVTADDVVVDLGSGLGKVVMLAALLTGARAHGVELQPDLVKRARAAATTLGLDVTFSCEDARVAPLETGTVFFLYLPFTGPILDEVVDRLARLAETKSIAIAALGVDLPARPSLVRRNVDSFWLNLYEGLTPRRATPYPISVLCSVEAERVALERAPR